ncbi:MAG: ABC transporter permease [Clostridiales bacterium]|jgi:ribose transport system permease protein|nr:ABC transporter permease [Clostridiales bacterium]
MQNNSTYKKASARSVARPLIKFIRDNAAILIGLLVISLLIQFLSGSGNFMNGLFFKQSNIMNVLRQVAINAMLACGMCIVIILGGIDISVGSTIALSGVISAGMITNYGLPVWLAVLGGLLVGLLCGMFNGFIISTTPLPPFIVTLAMMQMARGFAYIYTSGAPIRTMYPEFYNLGTLFVWGIPIQVIYALVIIVFTTYVLNRTRMGRHIFAVGGNREAARFAGINDRRVLFFAYSYTGLLAGICGVVLAARMFSGQPTAGDGQEMETIAATVLGGTSMLGGQGTIGGTMIGVLIMGSLSNGMNLLGINSFWQYVVKGVVILFAVYIDVIKKRTKKFKAVDQPEKQLAKG